MGYAAVEPVLGTGVSAAMAELVKSTDHHPASIDSAALKRAMDEHGLSAPSSHVALPVGEFANQILDEQEMLGSRYLITAMIYDEAAAAFESFSDMDQIKRLAERFNAGAEAARARGMRVGYHNHFWEFGTDFDGRSGLEVFYELVDPEVVLELDVYWAQVGGRNPVELIEALGDRVALLHVKDGDGEIGTPSTALGRGVVDLPRVLAAAKAAEFHVVELEGMDAEEIWPALDQSRNYLVERGLSQARRP
jgi:sugar phosphate isomerase/epimerase